MHLIWKLLRQHISPAQLVGFFLSGLVGMTIVMVGAQFYADTQAVYRSEDGFMRADYIILTKNVTALRTISGTRSSFSEDEIRELAAQDFVRSVGCFTPSAYEVSASINAGGGLAMSTDMFFESVPDAFVDVKTEDWQWSEGDSEIPIIIPRDYLDLYNFGFAQSQDLPEVSEGLLNAIAFHVDISGAGRRTSLRGRIVGFSSRLNTILVPQRFMDWANEHYASEPPHSSARLIMQIEDPTDEHLAAYIQEHGYVTDASKLDASKTGYLLRIVVSIVMSVGLLIMLLAFYILMLSIFLLVQKNASKLETLLLIGYSPTVVSRPYLLLTIGLNVAVYVLSIVLMLVVRSAYLGRLQSLFVDATLPGVWMALLIGAVLLLVVSAINSVAIRHKVRSLA